VPGISFDAVGLAALAVGPAIAALILGLVSAAKGLVSATSLPAAAWLWSGLIVSLLVFAASLHLALVGFDPELLGLQRLEHHVWSPSLGANLAFAVDGLSLCFLLSTTGLVPLTFVTLRGVEAEVVPAQVVALLLLESALIGGLLAVNWMAFVACWALSGLPVLVWMARFGGGDRAGADRAADPGCRARPGPRSSDAPGQCCHGIAL